MASKSQQTGQSGDFRSRAEEKARVGEAAGEPLSREAAEKLAHELRVHQIELEMQNEELRRAQVEMEASRARYFDLYDMAPVGYVTLGDNGLILESNLTASILLGVTRSELIRKPLSCYVLPQDQDVYYLQCKRVFETSLPQVRELRMSRKDGSLLWVRLEAVKSQNEDGTNAVRAIMSDITAHKQVETYLSMGQEVLQILNDAGGLKDSMRRVLSVLKARTGVDAVGLRLRAGDDFPYFAQEGFPGDFLLTENALVERGSDGGICRDQDGNVRLECTCGLVISGGADPSNPLFTRGGSAWTNDSISILDIPPGEDPRYHPRNLCIHKGYASIALVPIRTKDTIAGLIQFNDRLKGRFTLETIEVLEGIASHIGAALMRKQSEESLCESEERYRNLFELSIEGIGYSLGNRIIHANKAVLDMFGYESLEEFTGKSLLDHVAPESKAFIMDRLKRKELGESLPPRYEYRIIRKDGSLRDVEMATSSVVVNGQVYTQATFRDVTYRRRNEEDRQRAQKLESIGALAGGIAHDFNNMLTGIMGNIGLVRSELPPDNKLREHLEEAEKASLRAKGLTYQLLTFSSGGAPVKKVVSITALLKDSATLALRGSASRCEFSLAEDVGRAEIDEGQIAQVIANLVINAAEATAGGGVIRVAARNTFVRAEDALPLPAGRYVQIEVSDSGTGIPGEYMKRMFEPYFSTKGTQRGLGLATSYSIVKNHGGHIAVESSVGVGTTFRVYLPASAGPAPREAISKEAAAVPAHRGGRVLVMDDDEAIRSLLRAIVGGAGYSVDLVADGVEAVEKYAGAMKAGKPYDVVIMDLTVPGGMGGKEAIVELLRIDPKVRAIVSSGYANDSIMAEYEKYGFMGVVTKPYSVAEMVKTLRQVFMGPV